MWWPPRLFAHLLFPGFGVSLPDMPTCTVEDRGSTIEVAVQPPAWCDPDAVEVQVEPCAVHFWARTLRQVERDRPPLFHRHQQHWSHRVTLPAPVIPHRTRRSHTGRTLHLLLYKADPSK
ncbi:MAG: hypothetical protein IRY98_11320 [Alicyclobacillaceae bacterium]|nr:hypothetical protein [Alicyclobacillaceae bacterium]